MPESLVIQFVQHLLANMTERGMTQVVTEGNGFRQVLIEVQGASDGAGYLSHLQCMGEASYIVVTQWGNENLRLVLEPAEGLAGDDTVAVALDTCPYRVWLLRSLPAFGKPAFHGMRRKAFFSLLGKLADV